MALVTRTLATAMDSKSPLMTVDATTSLTAGMFALVDGEFVGPLAAAPATVLLSVARGQLGTSGAAHASSANAIFGLASDFASPPPGYGSAYGPVQAWTTASYSASGAVTLPVGKTGVFVSLNGTSALAMTVAAPTKDQDGACLVISGNSTGRHTVEFTGGLSGAGSSYDIITTNAGTLPITITAWAVNGFWQCSVAPAITGTVTNITGGIA